MATPNEHPTALPKRNNRLAAAPGQRSIQNYFPRAFSNANNITISNVTININQPHQTAQAHAAAGPPPAPAPVQAGDDASRPPPAARAPSPAARAPPPAARPRPAAARTDAANLPSDAAPPPPSGGRYAANGVTFDGRRFNYHPLLKQKVKDVVDRRFPDVKGSPRWSTAAAFLMTDWHTKAYFGPRYIAPNVYYTGIMDSDVRRFYFQEVAREAAEEAREAAEEARAAAGEAPPPAKGGRRPLLNEQVRALVKDRIIEAFAGPVDGETRFSVDYVTIELAIGSALDDARRAGVVGVPPAAWRPSRATVYRLIQECNLSWRKATSGSTLPPDWEELQLDMAARVAVVASTYNIPPDRIYNADQAGVCVIPNNGNARTLAFRGERRAIKIFGSGDKRQFTVMQLVSATGVVGPPQVIVAGKGKRVLAAITPEERKPLADIGGTISASPNHWSNNDTMKEWLDGLFVPYLKKREQQRRAGESGTGDNSALPANADMPHHIILLDCWYGHTDPAFRACIREKYPWLHLLFVPANCTSKLQPCDVAVQRPFKAGVAGAFRKFIRDAYAERMQRPGATPAAVLKDMLSIPFLRGLAPAWVVAGVEAAQAHQAAIVRVWEDVLPHLVDPSFIMTAHQRVRDRKLLKLRPMLAPEEEPDGAEEDVRPAYDHAALADELAAAVAAADVPMKRRRKEQAEEDEDEEGAVQLDDKDEADTFEDDQEGMERFVKAAEEGLDDDADIAQARELLRVARENPDEEVRRTSRREAALLCEGKVKRLRQQGRV